MILVRADANEVIATGHIMRCLSIAKELEKCGEAIKFVTADSFAESLILQAGFETICLNTVWNEMEKELIQLLEVINRYKPSWILIDSYSVTDRYLEVLRRHTRVAYMDDINSFLYPVDLLINYNMYAESYNYEARYKEAGFSTRCYIGTSYAPLREEFTNVKKVISNKATKILITSGGTDNYNVTGHILQRLESEEWFYDLEFYVILGKFNNNKELLQQQWRNYTNIHFLVAINNISDYMKLCDVAITAGGVTTYELCACGIPSIMYTLADNQLDIARTAQEKQLIRWVGDVRSSMTDCMEAIVTYLTEIIEDEDKRKELSSRMQSLVDGKGCKRIARILLAY